MLLGFIQKTAASPKPSAATPNLTSSIAVVPTDTAPNPSKELAQLIHTATAAAGTGGRSTDRVQNVTGWTCVQALEVQVSRIGQSTCQASGQVSIGLAVLVFGQEQMINSRVVVPVDGVVVETAIVIVVVATSASVARLMMGVVVRHDSGRMVETTGAATFHGQTTAAIATSIESCLTGQPMAQKKNWLLYHENHSMLQYIKTEGLMISKAFWSDMSHARPNIRLARSYIASAQKNRTNTYFFCEQTKIMLAQNIFF